MAESKSQPSNVSTEEEVRPGDEHVVTTDIDFMQGDTSTSKADDKDSKPAASGDGGDKATDKKPDQKPADSASTDDKDSKQESRRDRSAERRIKKLTRDLSRLQNARNADQSRIRDLEQQLEQASSDQAAAAKPEPQLKDFDTPSAYAKAWAKWDADRAQSSEKPDKGKPSAKERSRDAHAKATDQAVPDQEIADFQELGKERMGDKFMAALQKPGTAVDEQMGEFLLDSDLGPEMYVYLSEHQDEAKEIFDLSTRDKIKRLEAIESKVESGGDDDGELHIEGDDDDKGGKPADQDKGGKSSSRGSRESKASPPPSDTRERGTTRVEPDPENESMDEYAERRAKEEARRNRR